MRCYDDISVGETAYVEKTVSESDVYLFAGITGDFNPAHVNAKEAEGSKFKQRIAHGMLTAGFISAALGMKLPGPGSIYVSQEISFKAPVYFGDTIKAEVEVLEKLEKGRVKLRTVCYNQNGDVVTEGTAVLIAPRKG